MKTIEPKTLRAATLAEIRTCFPALSRIHLEKPVAYFDGPGGTQVPRVVVEAMNDYLYFHNANTHWEYPSSSETNELIADARQAFADFLNSRSRAIRRPRSAGNSRGTQSSLRTEISMRLLLSKDWDSRSKGWFARGVLVTRRLKRLNGLSPRLARSPMGARSSRRRDEVIDGRPRFEPNPLP